jgi:hypothetical protein
LKLLKIAAWSLLVAVIAVTLVPPELRPSSGLPLKVERFLAFAMLAGAFAMAYPKRWLFIALIICLGAILLELMQLLVPGRDASAIDAAAKVLGAVAGTAGAQIMQRLGRQLGLI